MHNQNYRYKDGKIEIRKKNLWIEPHIERYENLQPIGQPGANGVVIRGTHKDTKREDAIKIWLPRVRNGTSEIRQQQYLEEVRKLAKLNDPRIVTVYDAWTEEGWYYCSMEYIDGITYEKWLERYKDKWKRINMLINIFEAIVFYQEQGIIHGDIHSKNILVDKNEKIHIIDFGTSKFCSNKEESNYRENVLMYDLVKKTLENQFDKNVFLYKKYKYKKYESESVIKNDDIRKAVPLFFSKSVLCYLHLLIMINTLHDIINQPKDIYQYCRYIAQGLYLNMDYFRKRVTGKMNIN